MNAYRAAHGVATVVRQKHLGGIDVEQAFSLALDEAAKAGFSAVRCEAVADEEAFDLFLADAPSRRDAAVLRDALERAFPKSDVFVQPTIGRQKKLFVSDMDSTVIGQECIDEIAYALDMGEVMASITDRAMRGEIPFAESLSMRLALLKGAPTSLLQDVYDKRIHFSEGAARLLEGLAEHGVKTVLVSGGFTFFAKRVAQELGFDAYHANVLDEKDGVLTGAVRGEILTGAHKEALLREYAAKLEIAPGDAMAVGDGANDVPMIMAAGTGVAYRAKPATEEAAPYRLRHNDLDALLYVMGFGRKGAAHAVTLGETVAPPFSDGRH